ncbi:hypothetical protein [Tenggerimyces flavus]|uniref:Secreted protein n=1 Tax=Tenggerimyces flavus TaxID=1708749 RepID=A0ABV7YCX9_9ACTN|nr:hypothetical protein [Tenggerimyces flavus]MBM7783467.1 hypothetical protein [Tenggerimyces flavus]
MRRVLGLGAVLLAVAVAAVAPTGAQAAKPELTEIATGEANDFRATITATKVAAAEQGAPPGATATVEAFQRNGDTWTSVGKLPIGDEPWFWFVLTDLGAVCEFAVSDTPRPEVSVKLLVTPSVECAEVARFQVENGKLVEG